MVVIRTNRGESLEFKPKGKSRSTLKQQNNKYNNFKYQLKQDSDTRKKGNRKQRERGREGESPGDQRKERQARVTFGVRILENNNIDETDI